MERKAANIKSKNKVSRGSVASNKMKNRKICQCNNGACANNQKVEGSFDHQIEALLRVCDDDISAESCDFYIKALNDIHDKHIQTLISEKSKIDWELQKYKNEHKVLQSLIITRYNTVLTVLHSFAELDKFSETKYKNLLQEKIKQVSKIRHMMSHLTCCNSCETPCQNNFLSASVKKLVAAETERFHRQMHQKECAMKKLKKEMEDRIEKNELETHAELAKQSLNANKLYVQLLQIQAELETAGEQMNNELSLILHTIDSDKTFEFPSSCAVQKDTTTSEEYLNGESTSTITANVLAETMTLIQSKIQSFHKEFNSRTNHIKQTFNKDRRDKLDEIQHFKTQYQVTRDELKNASGGDGPKHIMDIVRRAEGEVPVLRKQLGHTISELELLTIEHERVLKEAGDLETIRRELELTKSELDDSKRALQQEILNQPAEVVCPKRMMELEEDVDNLRNQLSSSFSKLRTYESELEAGNKLLQEMSHKEQEHDEKLGELLERLTVSQDELSSSRKELRELESTCEQKVAREQMMMKKIKDGEKKMKTLQGQLAGTKHELEMANKEMCRLKAHKR